MRWLACFLFFLAVGAGAYFFFVQGGLPLPSTPAGDGAEAPDPLPAAKAHAAPPAPPQAEQPTPPSLQGGRVSGHRRAIPIVVISDGRLTAINTQQVPSMRDGKILFLATEVKPGEPVPPGREHDYFQEEIVQLLKQRAGTDGIPVVSEETKETRYYGPLKKDDRIEPNKMLPHARKVNLRRLREGDEVRKGEMLALLDPSLAIDDLWIKVAKLDAAEADRVASEKIRDETRQRYLTNVGLFAKKVVPEEELRASKLSWDRYIYETIAKEQQVRVAGNELRQSNTVADQHVIRSEMTGQVKRLLKKAGEAVKSSETVLELQDNRRLRIEGRVEYHYRRHLRPGDRVIVEPTQTISPRLTLVGHTEPITGVAVSKAGDIVSTSTDRTARVWDRETNGERLILVHPVAVRGVACSPTADQCVTAGTDGIARIWDLRGDGKAPLAELRDGHRGGINVVAYSPDGAWVATGGEDRIICIWQVEGGKRLGQITNAQGGHLGQVTTVQFARVKDELYLVSAGRDYAMFVWKLSADGSATKVVDLGRRTGDVPTLGVNPAAGQVLFDQGKELRIRSGPDGALVGVLTSQGSSFNTLALFSPDGNLILTAGGDGRLQLWRAPTEQTRGYELRQLAWAGEGATSGAFAPDGSFVVTGMRDRTVLVWPVPDKKEVATVYTAEVTLVDNDLDLNSRAVRVHAEIDNRWFELTERGLAALRAETVPGVDMTHVADRVRALVGKEFAFQADFEKEAAAQFRPEDWTKVRDAVVRQAEKAGPLLPGNTATLVVYPKATK